MDLPDWIYEWLKDNDPKQRKSPQSYGRELLSRTIVEIEAQRKGNNLEEEYEEEEESNEEDALREFAEEIIDLLATDDGLYVIQPPRRPPSTATSHGCCTIDRLMLEADNNYNPPDLKGKSVLFARFGRKRKNFDRWLPVLPKYLKVLRKIVEIQNS